MSTITRLNLTLSQVFALTGKLDDSEGSDTPRERFRRFLATSVLEIDQLRDYIEECLHSPGEQYNRALQDLINHVGSFLGFSVTYGRYHGVPGKNGFDGLWSSPKSFHIVIETKTSDVYAVRTDTLVGYVDRLISTQKIPSWQRALGLYVIGRPDPEMRQIEHAIMGEDRIRHLRIISADALLSLAALKIEYDISHDDTLSLIRPSLPSINPVVDLISRIVAEPGAL